MALTLTILGCGSSGGVPRPGSGWGACDPANPKNRRRRCSVLVERSGPGGTTSLLVDTAPDLREQLIDAGIRHLDAVLFSHDHADHTHGIDDMRALVLHMRRKLPAHADPATAKTLRSRFGYIFETPPGSFYPPILELRPMQAGTPLAIDGLGGSILAEPFRLEHGPNYDALGFRFGALAYAPDVSLIPPDAATKLAGLDTLILDCLREASHPSHFNLEQSLAAIAELKPKRAILTNLHIDLDYVSLTSRLPPGVEVAFDGMVIAIEA